MKRVRFRFTKAKWKSRALAELINAIAEVFPEADVLIFRAGRNMPILDINVYVDELNEASLKEAEKRIFSVLTDYDISHVVFKGIKVFDVSKESESSYQENES
jgi:hypothetical protein